MNVKRSNALVPFHTLRYAGRQLHQLRMMVGSSSTNPCWYGNPERFHLQACFHEGDYYVWQAGKEGNAPFDGVTIFKAWKGI
jgi:hypothetical protein